MNAASSPSDDRGRPPIAFHPRPSDGESGEVEDGVTSSYELAAEALRREDLASAVRLFSQASDRGDMEGTIAVGMLAYLQGDFDVADAVWRKAESAGSPTAIACRGVLAHRRGGVEAAAEHWCRSVDSALRWTRLGADASAAPRNTFVANEPRRVFISRASEMARSLGSRSYIAGAIAGVVAAGDVPVEMTYFAASSKTPEELCAQILATCDVYAAVVGYEYGTCVPPGQERSYTRMELDLAAEAAMNRLVFVVVDAELERAVSQDAPNLDRQLSFRKELEVSGSTLAFVRGGPDQLELVMHQALIELGQPQVTEPRRETLVASEHSVVPQHPAVVFGFVRYGDPETEEVVVGPGREFLTPSTFHAQMNRGSAAFWTLRWQVDHPHVRVAVCFGTFVGPDLAQVPDGVRAAGTCGYLSGFITTSPCFGLADVGGRSNVATVLAEWQYWDAAG